MLTTVLGIARSAGGRSRKHTATIDRPSHPAPTTLPPTAPWNPLFDRKKTLRSVPTAWKGPRTGSEEERDTEAAETYPTEKGGIALIEPRAGYGESDAGAVRGSMLGNRRWFPHGCGCSAKPGHGTTKKAGLIEPAYFPGFQGPIVDGPGFGERRTIRKGIFASGNPREQKGRKAPRK